MKLHDTIAAVSTPRGKGGIAVIRISGEGTKEVLSRVFHGRKNPENSPRQAVYGKISDMADGKTLDTGLAVFFPSPASFTGEDVAEISCHGGALLTETVLASVLLAGARPAEAGEFSRRALMNGKMTLSEAEALGALLEAGTGGQLALARGGMEGKLAASIRGLYEDLTGVLADIYAKIDYPEEDLNEMSNGELLEALSALQQRTLALADTWKTGRAVADGVETVICGPVNAGKSTLYNALVGREAAIVTDVAGTTRDVISEVVSLGQVTLRLSDTAGLRETGDAVEKIGVERAEKAMDRAELILAVFDGSRAADDEEQALLLQLQKKAQKTVLVLNKCDAAPLFDDNLLAPFPHVVRVSALKGDILPLRRVVEEMFLKEGLDLREDAVVSNARQYAALLRGDEAFSRAIFALKEGVPLDAVCVEAELALEALGEVDGRMVDEDIVNNIFSHFCVGK